MSLLERINDDMKTAMKQKDSFNLGIIRMLKGAVQLEAINKKKELTDEEVVDVVQKQIKMRKDSITEFGKAGRDDLVKQNEEELNALMKYMPEQLSEEEINDIIDKAFDKINPSSIKDMGMIMKEISPSLKGKADMGLVNQIVKSKLN